MFKLGKGKLTRIIEEYCNKSLLPACYEVAYKCRIADVMPTKDEFDSLVLAELKPQEVEE